MGYGRRVEPKGAASLLMGSWNELLHLILKYINAKKSFTP